ncbi:putative repeat protein (TIGR01451 family)/fimbrial isopeptide formation D2 family protein [Kribbella sp. VKM Ac-2571]|uniref:DUF7927 domain-containing protein n=1 Tax=Kribbella sp. VKM Ac-2571 TaxID=2512222 RepID=UPI0010F2BE2C|nr:DUF11 domain-containing protein [Kribbella sp. VKM Ac-2571]TDO67496.1 putative repeat protein (TIGR01451 family)/fimbrial isopeptide formation D2 family protein [Kribbella sp. VKM Ac-2571]
MAIALAAATALIGVGVTPAWAAPVYQITGQWVAGTPAVVANGNLVTGVWRINVNDGANPPANDPVPNVTLKVTATNGKFTAIPGGCKTTGVTPPSSISADGATLTCNLGTQRMGTAYVVQAPMVVSGFTGQAISATGTIGGQTVGLPPREIRNTFGMDMQWSAASDYSQGPPETGDYGIDVEWTLRTRPGSDPGPQTLTYTLTVSNNDSRVLTAGATAATGPVRAPCTPFDISAAPGHPWSGRKVANQTAPFVKDCTLVKLRRDALGRDIFRLTLSGIDYSKVLKPTQDSTGASLGTAWEPVASGSVWFTVHGIRQATGVTLQANEPTYVSASPAAQRCAPGCSLPTNNTEGKTVLLAGAWSHAWVRQFTGSGGTPWDNTYRVPQGELVESVTTNRYGETPTVPNTAFIGDCDVIDSRFSTYVSHDVIKINRTTNVATPLTGATTQYYVGPAPANPNTFSCAGNAGWTTQKPANLALIKAVRATYRKASAAGYTGQLVLKQTIKANAPIGQDVWTWGSSLRWNPGAGRSEWIDHGRDTAPGAAAEITPVPGGRYPYTTGARDVLHVVGPVPSVTKTATPQVVEPGTPFTYTLRYRADYSRPAVNGFVLTDTLPAGVTYVPGSATPEPTVTTGSTGQQVLTWRLSNVKTDTWFSLRFKAVAGASVRPGQALNNCVRATIGRESDQACAQVTVSASGYTTILKTPNAQLIPDPDGDGTGTGTYTVALRSFDPLSQSFTDTIDILPYKGDGRGTAYNGTYTVGTVTGVAGATVYYTTAAPATLKDDPADPSNGSAGDISGNTVGWTTTYTPNATAVRVIGPALAPGAVQEFKVPITTKGAFGGDKYVNRAQARAGHTELVMRTSAPLVFAPSHAMQLKKYLQGRDGKWYDANDEASAAQFQTGDAIRYRIVVTNTGRSPLTNIAVKDDKYPLGNFTIDSLAVGASKSKEYAVKAGPVGSVVNTACATAASANKSCDPANVKVSSYRTVKTSDPKSGSTVMPGDKVVYTVTVTQRGPGPVNAKFSDDLSKVLDDASYNGDVRADTGIAQYKDGAVVWSGRLPAGGKAVVTYSVTVRDTAGDFHLKNVVTSPGCAAVKDCTTEHIVPTNGRYKFSKTSDPRSGSTVEVGDKVSYTVRVAQLGAGQVENATITDDLSKVLDDARYNGDARASAGTVQVEGQKLLWRGDLAVGAKVTITYSVTVTDAGDRHLSNVVTSPSKSGTCDESVGCKTNHTVHHEGDLPNTGGDLDPRLIVLAVVLIIAGAGLFVGGVALKRRRQAVD